MDKTDNLSSQEQLDRVESYYDDMTVGFYQELWDPDHLHFGLFEPGTCPPLDETFKEPDGSTPALHHACQRMIDVTVAPAEIQADHHVLDAGCGIGGTAVRLAQMYGCRVTGVSNTKLHLEIGDGKAKEAGLDDRVSFKHADCSEYLPFDDESIDVVANIESACHYKDRHQFLREVYRVLKKGGRIVAEDWLAQDNLPSDLYKKSIQPICDLTAMISLESESGYRRMLQDVGLRLLEFRGFDGEETDNFRIFEVYYRNLFALYLCGAKSQHFLDIMKWVGSLTKAWKLGHFEIKRYCAEKPQ